MDNTVKGIGFIVVGVLLLLIPVVHWLLHRGLSKDVETNYRYRVVAWLGLAVIILGAAWIL
jgi:hypothetical protein